jgi:hypothetical protein
LVAAVVAVLVVQEMATLYDIIRKTVFPRVECLRGIPMDLDSDDFFDPRMNFVNNSYIPIL